MKIEIHVNSLDHQRTEVLSVVASKITKIVKIHVEVKVHQ